MRKVILASASPRRQELLRDIVPDFAVIPSNADESIPGDMATSDIPDYLAMLKARDVARSHISDIVIGSDTIVVCDDKVLGKPKDSDDAYRMLKMLSGKRHIVCTGCALVCGEIEHSFCEVTQVEFYDLTDEEIYEYIATNDCYDKAGAYGVQSKGKTLVKGIYGDYYNVVGLPLARLKRELATFINSLDK